MLTDDDRYIYGCISAGLPAERIAAKLCITVEEVRRRFEAIKAAAISLDETGLENLVQVFNTVCLQHQMIGEGLKVLGTNLSEPIMPEEIRSCIAADPEQTVRNLMAAFIILRPFKAPDVILTNGEGVSPSK